MRKLLPLLLILITVTNVSAQQFMNKTELVNYARTKYRESVRHSLLKEYREAVKILEELKTIPKIEEAERDWVNILYALSCNYSLLNENEKSLTYLEQAVETGFADYEHLQNDKDLDNIRNDRRFKAIIDKLEKYYHFWENPVFSTPYRENISENEKIAGLSKLWSEIKYNFVNFELVPDVNWDSLYVAYIPIIKKTKSTFEYYRTLEKLCAHLKDGHTGVRYPGELRTAFDGRVSIQTRLIENRVLITKVYDENLTNEGYKPGVEIVSVDGIPVMEYAEKYVKPYQNDNSPHGLIRSTFEYSLLKGPLKRPVILELKDSKGNVYKRTLNRVRRVSSGAPYVDFKLMNNNIGYVSIRSFYDDEIVNMFDSVFTDIKNTEALIIDLRENGGGNGRVGWTILSYFTDKPIIYQKWKSRKYRPIWRAWGRGQEWYNEAPGMWPADAKKYYDKPVVILARDRTASMAENFCLGFKVMKRGKIIGGRTMGSSGTPLFFSLPGGGEGQVVTSRGMFPDGTEFTGVGVLPNIEVFTTVKDVREGRDTVLERAMEYLGELLKK